jgi:hypothetical protein
MKFKRVYHDCRLWEEVPANMWGEATNPAQALEDAIAFTGDHRLYGEHMLRVIQEWPVSCENALTDYSLNRKAWVGHAAVALALNIPEDITRKAWGMLTDEQRLLANREAERAIQQWEDSYAKGKGLCGHLVLPVLRL